MPLPNHRLDTEQQKRLAQMLERKQRFGAQRRSGSTVSRQPGAVHHVTHRGNR